MNIFRIVLIGLCICGCKPVEKQATRSKVSNDSEKKYFVRLFMHELGTYSIAVEKAGYVELEHVINIDDNNYQHPSTRFYFDVPDSEKMYMIGDRKNNPFYRNVQFHLHSVNDINSAGKHR